MMNKKAKSIISVLLAIVLCFSSSTVAFASVDDGGSVTFELSSDKKDYARDETITITTNIKNSTQENQNVSISYLSTGFIQLEQSNSTASVSIGAEKDIQQKAKAWRLITPKAKHQDLVDGLMGHLWSFLYEILAMLSNNYKMLQVTVDDCPAVVLAKISSAESSKPTEPTKPADPAEKYTVTFDGNGYNVSQLPKEQKIAPGDTATRPIDPKRDKFNFIGWYTDSAGINCYDFDEPVNADITLYAYWITDNQDLNIAIEAISKVRIVYSLGDTAENVTSNITLPQNVQIDGIDSPIAINWSSNQPSAITNTGFVTRTEENQDVLLTATVVFNNESAEKTFELKVIRNNSQIPIICESIEDMHQFSDDDSVPDIYTGEDGDITTIDGTFSNVSVECADDAILALNSIKNILGINDPYTEFIPVTTNNTDYSSSYVLQQIFKGIPVYGRTVTVSVGMNGTPNYLNTAYKKNISISIIPQISEQDAKDKITIAQGNTLEVEGLYIYSLNDYSESPLLTYKINVNDSETGSTIETIFINATNGETVYQESKIISWGDADVNGNGKDELGNTRNFTIRFKQWDWFFYYMQDVNKGIIVYNKKATNANRVGSEINRWTDKTENSAYANLIGVYDWYNSNIRRNPVANHGDIKLVVHAKGRTDNACWCGENEFNFFDNSRNSKNPHSTAACYDVMAHEYTHGVLEYLTGGIPYSNATGAINEGYADIFGCIVEDNWVVGENWTGTNNGLRPIYKPSLLGYPEQYLIDNNWHNYSDTSDHGGVHTNCTVISYAAYLMNTAGISMPTLAKLWYQSLLYGLNASSQFVNVRLNVVHAAKDMGLSNSQIQIINRAFDDVNIKIGYTLTGKVTIADSDTNMANNLPLENAKVRLSGNGIIKSAVTKSNGNYTISNIPYGTYTVTVSKDGYITATQILTFDDTMENIYNVAIEAIPAEYAGEGYASGNIFDVAVGNGVLGLTLNIRNGLNNIAGDIVQTIKSGSNGFYKTSALQAGNYTIEVVDNRSGISEEKRYSTIAFNIKVLGNMTIPNQNGYVSSGIASDEIRIVLSWGSTPSDLDSHLVGPTSNSGKFHVYYSNKKAGADVDLDRDDTDSYGPETITIHQENDGTYIYAVHDYSNRRSSNSTAIANSGAQVIVYRGNNVIATYNAPTDKDGTLWTVFSYDSINNRISTINQMSYNNSDGASVLNSSIVTRSDAA